MLSGHSGTLYSVQNLTQVPKSMAHVEWEALQWVSWYNTVRLHGAIGHRPPKEME